MLVSLAFLIYVISFLSVVQTEEPRQQILHQIQKMDRKIQSLQLELKIIDAGYSEKMINNQTLTQINFTSEIQKRARQRKIQSCKRQKTKKVAYEQLKVGKDMKLNCQITIRGSYSVFQTPRSAYLVVNNQNDNSFSFYNSECMLISTSKNNQVKNVLCDRGLCDDGNVIILTGNNALLRCSEMSNFTDCFTIANLQDKIKGKIVGMALRGRGGGQLEIYIADSEGQIMVLDGQGKLRLTVSIQQDSKISHLVDMHPHPIAISSKGWIYIFQNNKYSLNLAKCPYLFHPISHVFVAHPYSSSLYLLSSSALSILQLKSQSKNCQISQRFNPINQIDQLIPNKKPSIAQHQGTLFIDSKVISFANLTVSQLSSCLSASFNFQQMKNNYRKGFFTLSCLNSEQPNSQSTLLILKQKNSQNVSSKNNTIIMIVILLLVVLLIFLFLRSTVPNLDYDEQLRYNRQMRYRTQVSDDLKSSINDQQKSSANTNQSQEEERNEKQNRNNESGPKINRRQKNQ